MARRKQPPKPPPTPSASNAARVPVLCSECGLGPLPPNQRGSARCDQHPRKGPTP